MIPSGFVHFLRPNAVRFSGEPHYPPKWKALEPARCLHRVVLNIAVLVLAVYMVLRGTLSATSLRAINRGSIETIHLSTCFRLPCDSSSIPRIAARTSWIAAHSNAEPRAVSRKRLRSCFVGRQSLPAIDRCVHTKIAGQVFSRCPRQCMFSGIDCAARSHWSRADNEGR